MDITTIIAVLGSLGGFETVKWAINAYRHRKLDARKEEASVANMEVSLIDKYEDRLAKRDDKVDAIYIELRAEQKKRLR